MSGNACGLSIWQVGSNVDGERHQTTSSTWDFSPKDTHNDNDSKFDSEAEEPVEEALPVFYNAQQFTGRTH